MNRSIILSAVFILSSIVLSAQISRGDLELVQKYFGVEKAAMLKEYMAFTPKQDSAFWPIYNKYETERLALGTQRVSMVDEYMKSIEKLDETTATKLVDKGVALEISFKNLQKKYFSELSKKIGPIKAAQFYQFEAYINNVINLSIQESIPFVGDMQNKHESTSGK